MSRPKYTYSVEVPYGDGWHALVTGETRGFCVGYLAARQDGPTPRLAFRVMRSDGTLASAISHVADARIGMHAGSPSADQYQRAADKMQRLADLVREREEAMAERRAQLRRDSDRLDCAGRINQRDGGEP